MRRNLRNSRGFTMIELVVATAITLFAIGGVLATLLGQQRSYESLEVSRTMQDAGRDALTELERSVRVLGYGVDPRYAFDMKFARPQAVGSPARYRDRTDAPDVLSFVARNARYRIDPQGVSGCTQAGGCPSGNAWKISDFTNNTVSLDVRAGDVFHVGRVLVLTCPAAARYTMVTVGGASPSNVRITADTSGFALPLAAADANQPPAGNPYLQNPSPANPDDGCYRQPGAFAFFVDRFTYFVKSYPRPGGGPDQPFLVLDPGLDLNGDNAVDDRDLLPISPGIEDFQVAWVYGRPAGVIPGLVPPDGTGGNFVVADSGAADEPDVTALAPNYLSSPLDASRFTKHPANVRALRLSLVVRGLRPDPAPVGSWNGDPFLSLENGSLANHNPVLPLARFRRVRVSTTVVLRNMASKSMFNL